MNVRCVPGALLLQAHLLHIDWILQNPVSQAEHVAYVQSHLVPMRDTHSVGNLVQNPCSMTAAAGRGLT